jgi:hypothetical protein
MIVMLRTHGITSVVWTTVIMTRTGTFMWNENQRYFIASLHHSARGTLRNCVRFDFPQDRRFISGFVLYFCLSQCHQGCSSLFCSVLRFHAGRQSIRSDFHLELCFWQLLRTSAPFMLWRCVACLW